MEIPEYFIGGYFNATLAAGFSQEKLVVARSRSPARTSTSLLKTSLTSPTRKRLSATVDSSIMSPDTPLTLPPSRAILLSQVVTTASLEALAVAVAATASLTLSSPANYAFRTVRVYCETVSNGGLPHDPHRFKVAYDKLVIAAGAEPLTFGIDEPLEDGDTALHLTCLYGYLPCVQLLLERGANLEVKDEDGAVPLHDACAGGFIEIVQLLINHASDAECLKRMLETVDAEGDTVSTL